MSASWHVPASLDLHLYTKITWSQRFHRHRSPTRELDLAWGCRKHSPRPRIRIWSDGIYHSYRRNRQVNRANQTSVVFSTPRRGLCQAARCRISRHEKQSLPDDLRWLLVREALGWHTATQSACVSQITYEQRLVDLFEYLTMTNLVLIPFLAERETQLEFEAQREAMSRDADAKRTSRRVYKASNAISSEISGEGDKQPSNS